ncbi:MAG: glycosyltransferase [Candidatus Zixiibacteriota bacterium]|nr:MAG: glycosyltransferase [candidate division Zixibacteria bacterium]
MAAEFDRGVGAVQLDDVLIVEGDKPLAHLQHLANAAENRFFYNGRAALGLPVLLRGTGMAIKAEVLKAYSYKSHSVTEDIDYAVDLLMGGVRITYTMDSAVYSAATSTYDQSVSQKERWAAGTFSLIGKRAFRLVKTGLTRGRFGLLELAFSLLILSRPVLIYVGIVAVLLSILASSGLRIYFALWGTALVAILVLYLLSGVFLVKDKKSAFKGVLHAPYYGFWLLTVQLRALFRPGRVRWTRTERKD